MLFLCCYYGVYPWRVLRPRSTKPAATELLHTSGACGSFACADKRINLRLWQLTGPRHQEGASPT